MHKNTKTAQRDSLETMPPALLTEKQLADYLNVSVKLVQKRRYEGGWIPYVSLGDRGPIRYDLREVEAFLTQNRRTSTSDAGEV